jgi:peptidyl-prolyl cis-trans isomerase SurA
VRDEVGRRLQMTQVQENAYYDQHKKDFEQPEQIRLSEILIPTPADAKDDTVAQALAKADDVAAKLQGGSKFEDLAKTYSGGQTAAQGGDLGMFKRGALAKVLEDKTFDLKAGEATAPIRTRQGFVILKVTEHDEAGVPPLKDIEPQIQEAMYMDQLQPALRTYLSKLREEAYIDIKPGFVDTGASSKQTKPVFTAYTAPVVKKKKVQQKQRFDRGGRFSTASANVAAKPATSTPAPAAAATSATKVVAGKKQKKIKREKVRFGQAPRNSLPAGPQEVAGVGTPGAAAAPGTAIAPLESTEQATSTSDVDPMAPKPVVTGKTRYSSREKEVLAAKKVKKDAKVKEKAIETPAPMTTEETTAAKAQAAPLGLNGDTAKKKKKKKEKGAAKERLQQKEKAPPAPAPEAMPYRTPKPDAPAPAAPSSDTTTVPATTTPQTPASPPPAPPQK